MRTQWPLREGRKMQKERETETATATKTKAKAGNENNIQTSLAKSQQQQKSAAISHLTEDGAELKVVGRGGEEWRGGYKNN